MRMIDKDALIKKFEEAVRYGQAHGIAEDVFLFGAFINQLENETVAPTIEVEPVKHGRWVETEDGEWECTNCKDAVVICVCGKDVTRHKAVCPNCGAKMDGGADMNEQT